MVAKRSRSHNPIDIILKQQHLSIRSFGEGGNDLTELK